MELTVYVPEILILPKEFMDYHTEYFVNTYFIIGAGFVEPDPPLPSCFLVSLIHLTRHIDAYPVRRALTVESMSITID